MCLKQILFHLGKDRHRDILFRTKRNMPFMNLTWHSFLVLKLRIPKKEVTLVIDPYGTEDGKVPRNLTAIFCYRQSNNSAIIRSMVAGEPFIIEGRASM